MNITTLNFTTMNITKMNIWIYEYIEKTSTLGGSAEEEATTMQNESGEEKEMDFMMVLLSGSNIIGLQLLVLILWHFCITKFGYTFCCPHYSSRYVGTGIAGGSGGDYGDDGRPGIRYNRMTNNL